MMFSFISTISVALLAASSASALAIPRSSVPATYAVGYLEDYTQYHTRYLALNCENQHNSTFFDQCCHPMLATETLTTARPPQCWPSSAASSSAAKVEPTSTVTTPADDPECTEAAEDDDDDEDDDDGDDDDDDDDSDDDDEDDLPFCDDEPESSSTSHAITSTVIPVVTSSKITADHPLTTSNSEAQSTPTSSKASPTPTTTKATPAPTTSTEATPVPSTTKTEPAPTTTSEAQSSTSSDKPTPTPTPTPSPSSATSQAPAPTTSASSNSGDVTGGVATFFYQNGNPGACGEVNPDSAVIAAIDIARYGDTGVKSPLCGKKVAITNKQNGKVVTVTIADACPTCKNEASIDLSVGAFTQIADEATGEVDIVWHMAD